ncbi:MAG: hydroxymethylpyrimidine/phosphomethylpyrimidine kinase, partial [Pseudomonadota bacterium]|nr:hydroxymethylpyrimidine/phosphomethylpyrimidine kinase [Pseudomonadota bacterium]
MTTTYPIQTHSFLPRESKPVVLAIGGSDSAGLAGVQMDSRACEALGVHCATAITAVTAQNNQQLLAINPVSAEVLEQQIDAALALDPQVIKIGLLGSLEQVELLSRKLHELSLPVVFDPVIKTSSDADILDQELLTAIKSKLLPLCTVLTPNLPEAASIAEVNNTSDQAEAIRHLGVEWCIITGGHSDDRNATDFCAGPNGQFQLSHTKIDTPHLRGSGCAFASTLAATMALGYEIRDGLVIAKMALSHGIENARGVNAEMGAVAPKSFPQHNWPQYSDTTVDA